MSSLAAALVLLPVCAVGQTGIFDSHQDIGNTPISGKLEHDPAKREYRVTGGGANMWGAEDAFHFAWKRLSGDVTISADVQFVGKGVDPHRKAVLIVRQELTPGSAYADIAVHGDGLTSLQFRPNDGAATQEIRSPTKAPTRIRLERRGNEFRVWAGDEQTGPQVVEMKNPVYVGIGICSHNPDVAETAVFSNVQITSGASKSEDSR